MRILMIWLILMSFQSLTAQSTGEITYEMVIDLHRRMTGDRAQFKEFVPPTRSFKSKLIYNETEAFYKQLPQEEEEQAEPPSGRRGPMRRMFRMAQNNVVYLNYDEGTRIEQRAIMDKNFLITGAPETYKWKITGETKQVGDFLCAKATHIDSMETVVAWFTTQVPVPLGPAKYGQLPGLILHVDVNDGERTFTAVDFNFREVAPEEIEKPTKGKEVTDEEFRTLMRERMDAERDGMRVMRFRQ